MKIVRGRREADEFISHWSRVTWGALALACIIFIVAVIGHAEDRVSFPDVIAHANTTIQVPILLSSPREIGAARVSFFDYDATGITFGGIERGAHCPPGWYFAVYDSMPEYPGAVLVQTIGSGLDFITGTNLELFLATFHVGDCGAVRPLDIARDRVLTHLSTIQLNTIAFSCAGSTCCCLPLTIDDGSIIADCTVDADLSAPPAWSTVKGLYR